MLCIFGECNFSNISDIRGCLIKLDRFMKLCRILTHACWFFSPNVCNHLRIASSEILLIKARKKIFGLSKFSTLLNLTGVTHSQNCDTLKNSFWTYNGCRGHFCFNGFSSSWCKFTTTSPRPFETYKRLFTLLISLIISEFILTGDRNK